MTHETRFEFLDATVLFARHSNIVLFGTAGAGALWDMRVNREFPVEDYSFSPKLLDNKASLAEEAQQQIAAAAQPCEPTIDQLAHFRSVFRRGIL